MGQGYKFRPTKNIFNQDNTNCYFLCGKRSMLLFRQTCHHHFLKITNTAITIKPNPTKWFHPNFSDLKNKRVKTINTVSVMASCMVLSCTKLKGPPLSLNPPSFAGTWNKYSKKASPQLITMMENMPRFFPQE